MSSKFMTRVISLLLAASMVIGTAACSSSKDKEEDSQPPENTGTSTQKPTAQPTDTPEELTISDVMSLMSSAQYTSELPDWTGKQMNLRIWQGHGTGDAKRVTSSNDVVSPEIKRVTGISLDADRSFDNGGMDLPSKLAVLAATNDFPEIGYNVEDKDLIEAGKLYDLTDLIPIYAPHIYERMQTLAPDTYARGYNNTGRIYALPSSWWPQSVTEMEQIAADNNVTLETDRTSRIFDLGDTRGWTSVCYVRDDILKLMYPDAKSQDEIEAMYMEKGFFTREEVYDVPIKSKDDFFDFLYDMKRVIGENNITEDGRPVYPTYVWSGQDNWSLGAFLVGLLNGLDAWNYFTYFDLSTKHIENGFTADFFVDDFRRFSAFVRDGIAPESSLIDNNEVFMNKINNGEYAFTYGNLEPDRNLLQLAEKPYRYRKIYLDIPQDTSKAVVTRGENGGHMKVSIFKDVVAEEDVPQILMWLDFLLTPAAMDLMCWGPESAGLWTAENGSRKFADKDLEDCLVYGAVNGLNEKYNLISSIQDAAYCQNYPCIYPGIMTGGFFNPIYQYDGYQDRKTDKANSKFMTGFFEQEIKSKQPITMAANVWIFFDAVPGMKSFWDVRGTGFESMLTKCLAAKSDEEFQTAYDAVVKFAADNGYTDEAVKACEEYFIATYPDDWAGYLAGN